MKKYKILPLCITVLTILQLTGCSSAENDEEMRLTSKAYDSFSYTAESAPAEMNGMAYDADFAYADEIKLESESISQTTASDTQNDLSARKIIKNANVSFQTQTYDEFMTSLEQCIASVGGYIESQQAYGGGIYSSRSSRSSSITARIPESNYNRFMTDVCTIGTVTYKSESSNDVTMSYVDTESRIKALETEYDALIEILEKATSLDDVIQLQSRISEVTYQLESYNSQLRKYDDLISYCTVNIDVSEVVREVKNEEVMSFGERIVSGLEDTFYDIGTDLTEFAVWFVTSLPYIIIWAAVIILIVIALRKIIKSRKEKRKKKNEQKLIEQYYKQANENTKSDKENP